MTLSTIAIPFFSCSSFSNKCSRNRFLHNAKENLSPFDYKLFCSILSEWESCPLLSSCFSLWKKFSSVEDSTISSSLSMLYRLMYGGWKYAGKKFYFSQHPSILIFSFFTRQEKSISHFTSKFSPTSEFSIKRVKTKMVGCWSYNEEWYAGQAYRMRGI